MPETAGIVEQRMTSASPDPAVPRALADEQADACSRLKGLSRQLDALLDASAGTTNDDEHDPEGATVAFERAQVQSLLDRARAERDELDRAAERVRAGTYGRCERCGDPIAEQRLEALPAARTCIGCGTADARTGRR